MVLDESLVESTEKARARLLDHEHEAERARVDFHHGIRRLHAAGGSLREIAERFALSHQRVHQIVATAASGGRKGKGAVVLEAIKDRVRDWGPFTRFTKEARTVVVRAQEEARALGHGLVGTEHLLLGVLRVDEAMGARVLARLGVELEPTRAEIVRAVGCGDHVKASNHLPLTPRTKRVLEHSLREALDLHHNYIGTEHILLGLVRERSGLAARLLRDLGADAERVRRETKQALASE
jgi:ATP-dependent Clp protease ATP-binding subunit ClpC